MRGGLAPLTVGMFLLVALSAFEQLATTTVMPLASREVGGEGAFAVASAAALATGVVGTIVAGVWADRRGPRRVIIVAIGCFALGLLLTGFAVDIITLVVGRLVQGLGSGALTVGFYVVIGRLYPPALHPKVFSIFSAAWVLPGLIGPGLAGTIADTSSWRWVFLGALGIVAVGVAAILMSWSRLGLAVVRSDTPLPWRRFAFAGVLAAALVVLNFAIEIPVLAVSVAAMVIGLLVGTLTFRGLVPAGTLRAVRGIPAVVAIACLMLGATFATQAFLTLYLIEQRGFSLATAGLALTFGGIAWPLASWLHSRFAATWPTVHVVVLGQLAVSVAVGTTAVTAIFDLDAWIAVIAWTLAGAGCGFAVPRLSGEVLRLAAPEEQGIASSAFTIAQLVAPAAGIAIAGTVLALLGPAIGFPAVFLLALVAPLLALAISGRVTTTTSQAASAHGASRDRPPTDL